MYSPLPPAAAGSGPPVAPPDMPTLGAYMPPQEGPPGPDQAGAIPKLVFGIMQQLDVLARAIPGGSPELDRAKALIQGAMIKAARGGGGTPPPGPGSMQGPPGGGPPF